MDILYKALLYLHIAVGFISVIVFWIPVFVKKGGNIHKKSGWVYVYTMWASVLSAVTLSINAAYSGNWEFAIMMGFLSLLTANPLWYAISSLKNKKVKSSSYKKTHIAINVVATIYACVLLLLVALGKAPSWGILMLIFGVLGITTAPLSLWNYIKKQQYTPWMKEHIAGMVISGGAAYTAFFAFGGRAFFEQFLTGYWAVLPWVTPTVLAIILIKWFNKKYAK